MLASTKTNAHSPAGQRAVQRPAPRWQTLIIWAALVALLALAAWMRLYNLGQPFDHDGYDEGVYWQSLRAMSSGYALYQQIFYSQPPFFLLSTYPFFALLGGTLWAARVGIAMVSLLGLAGAFLLGKALQGRTGALLAALLLVLNPLYFKMSQEIEAEVSSAAFSLLAVGAAFVWWENPDGASGLALAALAGAALVLGVMCKLFALSSIIPVGLLLLARVWQIYTRQPGTDGRSWRSVAVLVLAAVAVSAALLLPFLGSFSSLLSDVVTFHTQAKAVLLNRQPLNEGMIWGFALATLPLVGAAVFGVLAALIRGDWRVVPLAAWALATLLLLWEEVPLFPRHFVVLIPALISLTILGLGSRGQFRTSLRWFNFVYALSAVALALILVNVFVGARSFPTYYRSVATQGSDSGTQFQARVAADLRDSLAPDEFVVTDAQFIAALAGRSTPPQLVDTSLVRVQAGYLTLHQLIAITSQQRVHAVLFFAARLTQPALAGYHAWVARHFHLRERYGRGMELWVR
jgi:4-amino-4-deoxy-L-arabinose transferase-like glycosyltransferase